MRSPPPGEFWKNFNVRTNPMANRDIREQTNKTNIQTQPQIVLYYRLSATKISWMNNLRTKMHMVWMFYEANLWLLLFNWSSLILQTRSAVVAAVWRSLVPSPPWRGHTSQTWWRTPSVTHTRLLRCTTWRLYVKLAQSSWTMLALSCSRVLWRWRRCLSSSTICATMWVRAHHQAVACTGKTL